MTAREAGNAAKLGRWEDHIRVKGVTVALTSLKPNTPSAFRFSNLHHPNFSHRVDGGE